uniref:Sulfatase domain-containing protein n=1 Tax=Angiostrongylus cantonensis TaxID=6313 RepID=A0A0K0DBM5_ANGCA
LIQEWLHINDTAVSNNRLSVVCFYRCYDRIDDDDDNLHYDQWVRFNVRMSSGIRQKHEVIIMFQDTVRPGCEFVETSCERTSFPRISIYRNNHNQILKRESASSRARPGVKSVILIVLDSVSHSSFVRNMPKSLDVLKILYQSYIFDGMNKIGDQSFPNAVAFLAGRDYQTEFGDVKGFFDEHPLIWKDFENANYTTYYAEDYPNFNLFNYLAKGFREKPVHHYFRPFWLNIYGSYLHRRSKFLCYGTQAMHNIELNYLSQFLRKYRDSPKFALNWLTELGHDYMNKVNVADDDFANFLIKHYEELKESFLFVLSDHGHRFDSIRRTAIGRIEESLPFFSMHIPMDLRQKFPRIAKTVERNTQVW